MTSVKLVGYELCEWSEHGRVCAKHFQAVVGGGGQVDTYECPGVEGDTGECNAPIESLKQSCNRPPWAEYQSDRS